MRTGRRLRLAAVLLPPVLAAALALGNCGGGAGPKKPPGDEVRDLARRADAAGNRLLALVQHPWQASVPELQALVPFQSRIVAFVTEVQTLTDDRAPADRLAAEGRQILELFESRLRPGVESLEAIAPTADRLHNLNSQLQTLFRSLVVPRDSAFVLRSRYEDGWLRSFTEAFNLINGGLADLQARSDATRIKLGAAGLLRAQEEGGALLRELSLLARNVQTLDGKLHRVDSVLAPWSREVLVKARATTGPDAPAPEVVDRAAAAQQAMLGALPDLRTRWTRAKADLLAGAEGASAAFDALQAEIDAARTGFMEALLPLSRKLGLPDPK